MFHITIRKAQLLPLLAIAGMSFQEFKREGEVTLPDGRKLTSSGRCCYTLIDMHNTDGAAIVDTLPAHDRHLVPAAAHHDRHQVRAAEDRELTESMRQEAFKHAFLNLA